MAVKSWKSHVKMCLLDASGTWLVFGFYAIPIGLLFHDDAKFAAINDNGD